MQPSGKVATVIVAAAAVVLVGYTLYMGTAVPGPVNTQVPTSFSVNGRTYTFTYIATIQAEREAGLMNKKVTNATTMLFAFPSFGKWSFWMYDTNTSLDMIWVNGTSGQVVYVVHGAQPCYDSGACAVYTPTASANYVIEAEAGFSETNGISVGTTIQLG